MKVVPVNNHVIIRPVEEKTAYVSSQVAFEERGEVIAVEGTISTSGLPIPNTIQVGMFVYFDSWCASRYKDSNGEEFWLIPIDKIRAIEVKT